MKGDLFGCAVHAATIANEPSIAKRCGICDWCSILHTRRHTRWEDKISSKIISKLLKDVKDELLMSLCTKCLHYPVCACLGTGVAGDAVA
jgi:hypothetical protein